MPWCARHVRLAVILILEKLEQCAPCVPLLMNQGRGNANFVRQPLKDRTLNSLRIQTRHKSASYKRAYRGEYWWFVKLRLHNINQQTFLQTRHHILRSFRLSGLYGPTSQFLTGTHEFSELVLARMTLLMDQSRSGLPLRSAKARVFGKLWREEISAIFDILFAFVEKRVRARVTATFKTVIG